MGRSGIVVDMGFEERHAGPEAEPPTHTFAMRFSSTPRGARLARRLALERLHVWGHPYDSATSDTVALIVAELSANAVRHGRVAGRDFHLALTVSTKLIRVEVSDARAERRPPAEPSSPTADSERGRGLLLVDALATRWGGADRDPIGKTVWAELVL